MVRMTSQMPLARLPPLWPDLPAETHRRLATLLATALRPKLCNRHGEDEGDVEEPACR